MSIKVLPFYRIDTASNCEALYSAIVRFRCAAVEGYRLWTHGTEKCGHMCWELCAVAGTGELSPGPNKMNGNSLQTDGVHDQFYPLYKP